MARLHERDLTPKQAIQTLRAIILAMCAGLVAFAVVSAVVVSYGIVELAPQVGNILLVALLVLVVAEIPVYVVLRRAILAPLQQVSRDTSVGDEPTRLEIKTYTTLTIIGAAMSEGIGLFGIVIYMSTARHLALLAPALALLALGLQLPTRAKLDGVVTSSRVV